MSLTNLRDWPEDFVNENGKYRNICASCGEQFLGHKRRAICRVCDSYYKRADDPQTQETKLPAIVL